MILNGSHLVITTPDVPRITRFFKIIFEIPPHFENELFSEFVLTSGFRIAFFKPVGKTLANFSEQGERGTASFGVTVKNVDEFYSRTSAQLTALGGRTAGEPKTHPWGEKSFLLIDADGNRWEITQSPQGSGFLTAI